MAYIKIITATPGLNTQERILRLIEHRKTGITIKEMSKKVNRPVSMLQIYLQQLINSQKIIVRKSKVSRNLIYYPQGNG